MTSPLTWLTAVCQPSSLVSTSVSTPLFFHSRMFSSLLPLSTSVSLPYLPSLPPLWWYMLLSPWNTGSEPKKPSLLMATSSVLGTLLDNSSTSVYRPIGALVCKPPKGQVAQLSNMAPFYLWSLYLLYWVGSWSCCQRNSGSVTETTSGGVCFSFLLKPEWYSPSPASCTNTWHDK